MILNPLGLEPTWPRVYTSVSIGGTSLLIIAIMMWRTRKAQKRDIYKPSTLFAEAFGLESDEGAESTAPEEPDLQKSVAAPRNTEKSLSWSFTPEEAARVRTPRFYAAAAVLALISSACMVLALISYIVLTNWDDGQRRAVIGDDVGALLCYTKALRVNPQQPKTHLLIAKSQLASGKTNAAIEELRWIVRRRPDVVDAAVILGDALETIGRPAEAVTAYQSALKVDQYNPAYLIGLGTALEQVGRLDEADTAYEKAILIDKNNVTAHCKLGSLLIITNHMDEGLAHCKKAVSLNPKSVLAQNALGIAYAHFGEFDKAILCLRKATLLSADFPVAWYDLGVIFEKMNDKARAIDSFRSCASLLPHNAAEILCVNGAKAELQKLAPSKK